MSSDTWTQCAAKTKISKLKAKAFRVVEAQHEVSTLKLVDTGDEQDILEQEIEAIKPDLPQNQEWEGLHYLLATPFRYPPLEHGSRFGTIDQRGLWYGALSVETALAEKAFYQLAFLQASESEVSEKPGAYTVFWTRVETKKGLDLTSKAFAKHQDQISHKTRYKSSQRLGKDMREAGVEAFLYSSARCREGKKNIGVFTPRAFAAKGLSSRHFQAWASVESKKRIIFKKTTGVQSSLTFFETDFWVKGVFPDITRF